ncbi:hypothetical protein QYE76_031777 [Lolium multiflorum]|uniref:AMP-dependent synthetase/ligase domain-containing protein n=1 Tax=Lolium multiflorum TaxID=4521 RepID=A0AAD8VIR6_LOLMU|nr:hypothetical protein QYE76_031777 [Lolium multiflorum]
MMEIMPDDDGDHVVVFAQNIPAMCQLHFAVPMSGAVLCALNWLLDTAMASVLLRHSKAKVIFVDVALLGVAQEALVSAAGARAPVAFLHSDLESSRIGFGEIGSSIKRNRTKN